MTYKFAICDDEVSEINYLKQLVEKWAINSSFSADINVSSKMALIYSTGKSFRVADRIKI